jgi:hypothetical protein
LTVNDGDIDIVQMQPNVFSTSVCGFGVEGITSVMTAVKSFAVMTDDTNQVVDVI